MLLFITRTLFALLFVRVGILLTCAKHLHDRIFALRGEVWVHKTSLKLPLFIEVLMLSQESERLCIYALRVSSLPLCTFLLLDFGNVPTA